MILLRHAVARPLVRFLAVGGVFAAFFALASAGMIRFAGAAPLAAATVIYAGCIPLAYQCQKRVAFGVVRARKWAFATYCATQIASIILVSLVTTRLVTHHFWPDVAILLATSALAAVTSFLVARFVTFAPDLSAPRAGIITTCASERTHR